MKPLYNSTRLPAIVSGVALIIMTLAAFFSYGYAHSQLFVLNDALLTFSKLENAQGLFVSEIIGWLIIILTDIIVAIGFYLFLKPTDARLSGLAAFFRLAYVGFLTSGLVSLISASFSLKMPPGATALDTANQVYANLQYFENIWSLGLIVFGLHLVLIGWLALKSISVPKVIGILLIIAGFSYSLIHALHGFIPQVDLFTNKLEAILTLPMMIGELSFGGWLLIKGGKTQ